MPTNSFDKLVSNLSAEERENILERMRAASTNEEINMLSPAETITENDISIPEKIRSESMFFKIMLWLKSVFTNSTADVLYNEIKLAAISRNVERNFPGLIDSKKGLLLNTFYDRLNELKTAADFIRPYIVSMEHDEGNFLIFLGGLIIPEVTSRMDTEADPYINPVSGQIRNELKVELVRNMEDIFQSISREDKNKMYEAVKSIEWLKQFVKLPLNRFISLFSNSIEKVYTCPFSQLENEIGLFAKTLSRQIFITDTVLEAIYLFSMKGIRSNKNSEAEAAKAVEFMNKAKENLLAPKLFMSSVPIYSIGNIVYTDICWKPEDFSGGEDWFVKFKTSWKKIFEQKWKTWIQECKKESLREILKTNFSLELFPILPFRPWSGILGITFKYEYTAGFLSWYFKEKFSTYELNLKTLMVEGKFHKKENLVSFTEAYNEFIQISVNLADLNRKLQNSGEYGSVFMKFQDGQMKSLQGQEKIESLMLKIESDISTAIRMFGESCRLMNLVLNGVLGIERNKNYDTISNFSSIQGRDNAKFMAQISETNGSIAEALKLIAELEVVDTNDSMKLSIENEA